MLYFVNPCSPDVVKAMRNRQLGFIDTPAQGNTRPDGVTWCADNGCFSNRWKQDKWWRFLTRHTDHVGTCTFAVAPDVVADAEATLERSLPWLPRIRALGYPVAYVGQDGQDRVPVPWDEFDAFFVGGSTEWKLGPVARDLVAEAKQRGKWAHMGRVNSMRRYDYARGIGCDSADGTYLTFGPTVNLPKVLKWIDPNRWSTT